jgi:3-oxoacyl-[acyl-carrier-protein] synthase-3
MRVKIVGTGRHLPERCETTADLAPRLGVSAKWISSRTGVLRRYVSDRSAAQMGASAARQALGDGPPPDLIINASAVPQQVLPDSAVFIQAALGYSGIPSYSIHATCLSFPVALYNAAGIIAAGGFRRVLVVSSELGSWGRSFDEPESAALFGDGAGAAVLEPTPAGEQSEVVGFQMGTWPQWADLSELRGGGTRAHPNDPTTTPADNLFHMDGAKLYKTSLRIAPGVFRLLFDQSGVSEKDVQLVVPHQASGRAVAALSRFGFSPEIVVSRVEEEGNCVAASIPMALAYAHQQGRLERGDLVLLCGIGAGLSAVAMLLRW